MKRTTVLILISTVVFMSFISVKGRTITVDKNGNGDFETIQSAVDSASNGDTIFVRSGIYIENVFVSNKSIYLIGEDRDSTVIKGDKSGHVVQLYNASNSSISTITIRNAYGTGNDCLFLSYSNNVSVNGCVIKSSSDSDGISIYRCNFIDIDGCKIEDNTNGNGIVMMFSCNNTIRNNDINNNQKGIFLQYLSSGNRIYNNNIDGNLLYGLQIISQSLNNIIFENVFKNNGQNAEDRCSNLWYDDSRNRGNYWDDYQGRDSNHDGIGDTPYHIPGGNNQDIYVLGFFSQEESPQPKNQKPVADAGSGYYGEINSTITFDASQSYDTDGSIVNYTWDFGDGSVAYGVAVIHSYSSPGNYTVTLTVRDDRGAEDSDRTVAHIIGREENRAPIAVIDSKDYGDLREIIIFNASQSYDPDGSIVNYIWNFGDGKIEYGKVVEHSYTSPGRYSVELKVVDNDGFTNSTVKSILIRNLNENINIRISIYPKIALAGSNIKFDVTNSTGNITTYIWDFGDGESFSSDESRCNHTYNKPGVYNVNLTAVYDNGERVYADGVVVIKGAWRKATPGFELSILIISLISIIALRRRK